MLSLTLSLLKLGFIVGFMSLFVLKLQVPVLVGAHALGFLSLFGKAGPVSS
jgi:hypothetical protein